MRKIDLRIAFFPLIFGLLTHAHAEDSMPWVPDLATAYQLASQTNKLVLVHFKGDGCGPCRRVEKNVFSRPIFGYTVAQKYVPVLINATSSPDIARQFGVTSWPTDIIMTADGRELHRMISPQDMRQYTKSLGQIAWRFEQSSSGDVSGFADSKRRPADLHQAARAHSIENLSHVNHDAESPPHGDEEPSPMVATTVVGLTPAYKSLLPPRKSAGVRDRTSPFRGFASGTEQEDSRPSTAGIAGTIPNAEHQTNPPSPPPTEPRQKMATPAMIDNLFVSKSNAPGAASSAPFTPSAVSASPVPLVPPVPPVQSPALAKPVVRQSPSDGVQDASRLLPSQLATPSSVRPPSVSNVHPTQVAAAVPNVTTAGNAGNRHQLTSATIPSPNSTATGKTATANPVSAATATGTANDFCMDGYCCVTLMDEVRWVEGDTRWGARHRGKVFLFQSAAAQKKFLDDPDKYSPVLVGYDPVAFRETGLYREGSRSYGVRYQDRMYFFTSEDALQRFGATPWTYAETARQAMLSVNTPR